MKNEIPSRSMLESLLQRAKLETIPASEMGWLAPLIDHTLLKPGTTEAQVRQLCSEAKEWNLGAVCVALPFAALCVSELKGSGVSTAVVAGFPEGNGSTAEKVKEAAEALRLGATEIDMVIQVKKLKEKRLVEVFNDICQVVREGGIVKVILETCLLDEEEKILGCGLAKAAGAHFLKTSTGFSTGGATEADVAMLRRVAGRDMGVKASGGVRTQADAIRMVLAGANRIGTSAGVALVSGVTASTKSGVY